MKVKHPGLFNNYLPRELRASRAWLRNLDAENRRAFAVLGLRYANEKARDIGRNSLFHIGGIARAKTARRDAQGRFLKKEMPCTKTD